MDEETVERQPDSQKIFKGSEAFGKLSDILKTAGKRNARTPDQDVELNSTLGLIEAMSDYQQDERSFHGDDRYLALVVKEEGLGHFELRFVEAPGLDLDEVLDHEEKEWESVNDEDNDELASTFSLIITPHNIIVVGGSKDIEEKPLSSIGDFIEAKDEDVSRKLNVPIAKKAVFIDAAGISDGVSADKARGVVNIASGSEIFSRKALSVDFKNPAGWALGDFYFANYEYAFEPARIDRGWLGVEHRIDKLRTLDGPMFASMPKYIVDRNRQAIEEQISRNLVGLKLLGGDLVTKEIADELKDSNYDFRKVPQIFEYKRFTDWIRGYKSGFVDLMEAVLSDDPEQKKNLGQFEHAGIEADEVYEKIIDLNVESNRESDRSASQMREYMKKFMYHIIDQYGLTYFELAKATSTMSEKDFEITSFCKVLGVDYQDALQTWADVVH